MTCWCTVSGRRARLSASPRVRLGSRLAPIATTSGEERSRATPHRSSFLPPPSHGLSHDAPLARCGSSWPCMQQTTHRGRDMRARLARVTSSCERDAAVARACDARHLDHAPSPAVHAGAFGLLPAASSCPAQVKSRHVKSRHVKSRQVTSSHVTSKSSHGKSSHDKSSHVKTSHVKSSHRKPS